LKENQIVVNVNIDPSIMLNTYLNECEQVILNIISNAKDVLVSNNVKDAHIDIFALEDENVVKLTIEDNAGGIKVRPKSKIFEPYFTTKDEAHGTGIGLYMSKIIIEKNMKGKLRVKNVNNGARFEIFFVKN
ncbi:MAG: HAMP domain-containing sensor histidine kinase, partial [Arcobacteraceae bacterium]|nr:HAMP domain-containing sensor histidine kinase [Arcobacteraceae bacterium]